MNDGLKDNYRQQLIAILSQCERVEKVMLFGSRAMGAFTTTSDIDIVLFGDELTLTDLARLAEQIENTTIPQTVDLVLHRTIESKELLGHIKRHGMQWLPERKRSKCWAMENNWIETTVGDFCPFTYGKSLPKKTRDDSGCIPVFGSKGIVGAHSKPYVDRSGIIIGRKGTVGAVAYSPNPFWPIDTTFYVTEDEHRNLRYTYYLLKSIGLEQMNADSAVPGLNRDAAHARIIKIPPLTEQKAIAHILGSLDDKIELNRRMNETLEAMAQALFKSWFIDFDPVLDNAILAGNPIPDELEERAEIRRVIMDQNQPSPPTPLPEVEGSNCGTHYRGGFNFSGLVVTVKELRQKQTSAEEIMWALLRNRNFMGLKFRRQHQIGEYIADFYCHDAKLVIELDGKIHEKKIAKDKKRNAYMQSRDLTVLHFTNEDFLSAPEATLNNIAGALETDKGSSPFDTNDGIGFSDEKSSSPCGRGRGEGLPEHIRKLFPSEFEHTEEMGWIPKGWRVGHLSDVCCVKGGYAYKSKDFSDTGDCPVIKIKNINQNKTVNTSEVQFIPQGIADKTRNFWLSTGDLLMAMTGATVGKFGIFIQENGKTFLLNQRVAKFFPVNEFETVWFAYACINQEHTMGHIINVAHGSAQPNISADTIMATKIIKPDDALICEFEKGIIGNFNKIISNGARSKILSNLRDSLLPQLLSGEMRIPEAEKLVEGLK